MLVNANLLPFVRGLEYARIGVDFPESFRALAGRPERLSDHDALVAFFNFSATAAVFPGSGVEPGLSAPEAWPNPSRGACRVSFALASAGDVRLDVYDVSGRRLARLGQGRFLAGPHVVEWDGRDASGARVSAGHYFVRLESAGQVAVARLVVID